MKITEKIIEKIQKRTLEIDMSECNWGEGVALWGLSHSVRTVPCDGYLPFLKEWVRKGIAEERFRHTVNNSIPCIGLGEVYRAAGDEECLRIMRGQAEYLMHEAPRLANGALIHSDPYAEFGRQMWADTVFMAGLFLAYMGRMTDNQAYIDEAKRQLKIHIDVLQAEDGLLYHGWDETLQDPIGCKWGRANAWVSVCIVEMLDYAPADEEMILALKRQLDAVMPLQKENGLWRTVLDGSFSYLEASSAYGFGYAILKGVRLGVLDKKYLAAVDRMKETLFTNVDKDGMVNNISAGTPVMRNEAEYNIICQHRIQTWGQGLALLYFSECQRWEDEKHKKHKKPVMEQIQDILAGIPFPETEEQAEEKVKKIFSVKAGGNVHDVWEELKAQMSHGSGSDDFVLRFEKGEHMIAEPLCIDDGDGAGAGLIIEGDGAVLTGSMALTAPFLPVEGKPYYRCRVGKDSQGKYPKFHFMTINGRMIRPAGRGADRAAETKPYILQYKRTYDAATKAETNVNGAPKLYLAEELFQGVCERDFETMELYLELHWYFNIVHVTGIDREDRIPGENLVAVYIKEEEYRSMRAPAGTDENYFPGHIYWVENCLTFLEKPGSYFYDRRRGILYYYPRADEAAENLRAGCAMPENLLVIKNRKNVTIRNMTFSGVDHKAADRGGYHAGQAGNVFRGEGLTNAGVYCENIDGLSVYGCTFRDMAGDGLSVRGRLRRVKVASNRFRNIGATAIRCGDFCVSRWTEEASIRELLIERNDLNGIGWFLRESVALLVSKAFNARIWYNTIRNCSYTAISVGTHYGPGSFQKDEQSGNLFHVAVAFNYITDFMTDMRDGAAIYTLGYNGDTGKQEPFNFILGNVAVWSDISGDIHGRGHTSGWYNDNESTHWLDLGNIQFLNSDRRWTRMFFHYVQTTAHNIKICRNAYVNCMAREALRGSIGDLEQGEDSAVGREILYWNIDEERNIYEADTACFVTAGDLTEEWRQIVDNAGCTACT